MEISLPGGNKVFVPAVDILSITKAREVSILRGFLDPRRNDQILDVGCGTGFWTHRLSKRCAGIVGVDIATSAIETARRHFSSDQCKFLVSQGEVLPFASETFDKIISVCALEHFNSDVAALREMNRVLKRGGSLALSVDSLSSPHITTAERSCHAKEHAVNNFYQLENLRARLVEAGFELLESRFLLSSWVGYKIQRLYWTRRWKLFVLFPLLFISAVLGDKVAGLASHGYILIVKARKTRTA